MKKMKKIVSGFLAAAILSTSYGTGIFPKTEVSVDAMQRPGTAPYINTWLVAGPSDHSIVEEIYGQAPIQRPADGNWASVATVSASSTWKTNVYDFPEGPDEPKNLPTKAIDGDKSTCWLSQMHDNWEHGGDPAYWPEWDPAPTFYLDWKQPITVKTVDFYNRYDSSWGDQAISQINEVKVTLRDSEGNSLAEKTVTEIDHKGNTPGHAEFDAPVENVSRVELLIVHDGVKELRNVGLGFSEVEVYDGEETEPVIPPEDVEKLDIISSSASSILNNDDAGYGPAKALDGDVETWWPSNTQQGIVWDPQEIPALTAELQEPSTITALKFNLHERDGKKLHFMYQLVHKNGQVLRSGKMENVTPGEEQELVLDVPVENVKQVVFKAADTGNNTAPNHLGFNEVEAWGVPGETGSGEPEPLGDISPVLGESFGDSQWQYFDDRIFNRNTDDYQDLYGYFKVKQGQEVEDKYVYAHTYVYSDKEQDAQIRFVTTGLHKLFVNDILIDENTTAVESSNKDQYIRTVSLKQGWNKVLLEIKQDRVMYLGFYARITTTANGSGADTPGDLLEGITCSVTGPHTENNGLTVVTQGLDIDKAAFDKRNEEAGLESNQYPDNEMPNGYVQWPYVWNKAVHKTGANYAPQASLFQFEAGGGVPGYTWEIVEGKLPDGLTLSEDGKIDGFCEKKGEYPFTIQVTDAEGNTAQKETKIIVKERPNKWFEEGKMSALSHNTGAYTQYFDPNFSFDLWAERAKEAGMTMLSTEAVQGIYFWPAPGATNANLQHPYTLDENGKPKDMVKLAKEAAERHGLRFGVYYASEGSNRLPNGHTNNSNGFFMNVEDLMKRYDPAYLFFDGGPQSKGNTDAMWSAVRAYNDYALIQANDQNEVSDNDLTILETEYTGSTPYTHGGYWETNNLMQNKYTVNEWWTHPFIKEIDAWAPYAGGNMRDDWRLFAEFIIYCIGHGSVANYDQMIISNRGVNWNGINFDAGTKDSYYYWPLNAQKFIDIREHVNAWMKNEGGPDLHESLFGTMPYYFDTYEKKEGYHENTEKEPFLTAKYGEGPEWGYTVARDQYVYMHMTENTIGNGRAKKGFTGQESIYVGPFDYEVEKVEWLNKGVELNYTPTEKDGKIYITIDTSSVETDPVDTIIKITTANPVRDFQLTGVKLFSSQETENALQLRAEAYLKTFTSVFADADLTYSSEDESVAKVDENGLVTPVAAGKTTIHVVASYEGKTAEDTYQVQVRDDGTIAPAEELIGVVMRTDGVETFGEFSTDKNLPITFEGRTEKGGGIDILRYDDIKWHYGICSGQRDGYITEADAYWHARETDKLDILKIVDDEVVFNGLVPEEQNVAIWAEITIDGKTYTTNMNYLRIYTDTVLSEGIVPEVSSGEDAAELTDGIINSADGGNTSRWTPASDDHEPTVTMKLDSEYTVSSVSVFFNNKDRRFMNTPSGINIQISSDGQNWQDAVIGGAVPSTSTIYCYEVDQYNYPIGQKAQYVKVSFPGGAAGDQMDVLEIKVNGYDGSQVLSSIETEKTLSQDNTRLDLTVKGYTGLHEELDMSNATITVSSDNEEIAAVDGTSVTALAAGSAKITVSAVLGGFKAEEVFYVKVDENLQINLIDYLKSIDVQLDHTVVDAQTPIQTEINGILNTGEAADLSKAEISMECSDDALQFNRETGAIVLTGDVEESKVVEAKFVVTLDGVTLESEPMEIGIAAGYLNAPGRIEAEDGIIVDVGPGNARISSGEDGGTAITYIQEGAIFTYFVKVEQAGEYQLSYRAVTPNMDQGMECYVDGSYQGRIRFEAADDWTTYSTVNHPNTIHLDKGVNVITFKPKGGGYVCNFNWFELTAAQTTPVDKSALEQAIANAEQYQEKDYTEESWNVFADALAKAIEVNENVNATQEEVDAAANALNDAIANLEKYVAPNKTLLQKTYEYALTLSTEGVTESAAEAFEQAKAAAKAVLDDPKATQEEVNTAWDNLLVGIWGLGLTQGDKTMLEELIARADEMMANADKYVQDNWQQLVDALEAAKKVMDDGDAMKEDVEAAADALLEAILAQRYKADKSILEGLINKANGMDLSQYTAESVALFKAALAEATQVLADESLSEDDQEIVDAAVQKLDAAIDNLSTADETPSNPDNPDGGEEGTQAPTTGDHSDMTVLFTMVIAMMMFASLAIIWRKKRNEM